MPLIHLYSELQKKKIKVIKLINHCHQVQSATDVGIKYKNMDKEDF